MPGCECYGPYRPRTYKRWRYPGVPIPHRLRSEYRDPTAKNRISF